MKGHDESVYLKIKIRPTCTIVNTRYVKINLYQRIPRRPNSFISSNLITSNTKYLEGANQNAVFLNNLILTSVFKSLCIYFLIFLIGVSWEFNLFRYLFLYTCSPPPLSRIKIIKQ